MDAPQALPHTVDLAYEREIDHPDAAHVAEIRRRLANSQD
jgi:hypothetical protein